MRKLVALVVVLTVFSGISVRSETLTPGDFDHSMEISFSGYTNGVALVNFPALVKLSLMASVTCASADGYDLRFTDSDGITVINYEIEEWSTTGSSAVWVQIPELASTGTDSVWAYWGNTAATNAAPSYTTDGSTWSEGYGGVWHMHGTSGDSLDSSSNGNDGTPSAGINRNATGKIDGCDELYGSAGTNYYDLPANTELMGTDGFTISTWMNPDDYPTGSPNYRGTIFSVTSKFSLWLGNDGGKHTVWFANRQDGNYSLETANNIWTPGQWHHVVVTHDEAGSAQKIYVDGVEAASGANAWAFTAGTQVQIGKESGYYFDGHLDEIRMSTVSRSADWVRASYQVTAYNETFVSCGDISGTGASQYWDTDTASGLQYGNGTWDESITLWSDSTSGSNPLLTWEPGSVAAFTPSGISTVTVSGTVAAMGMVFDGTGYTVGGGAIVMGSSGVTANVDAKLDSMIMGNEGFLKDGSGTLTFGGRGVYSGLTTISDGTLKLGTGSAAKPVISDCVMWLMADTGIQMNDAAGYVSTWVDQSGSGNDAANATGAQQPALQSSYLNGHSVVRFDGGDDELPFDGNILVGTDYTFIILEGRRSNKSNNYFVKGSASAANQNLHVGYRYNTSLAFDQYATGFDVSVGGYVAQEFNILSFRHHDVEGKDIWEDGVLLGHSSHAADLISNAGAAIGGYDGEYNGDIAEILIFDRALSTSEREEIETYLENKWSDRLPEGTSLAIAQQGKLDLNGMNIIISSIEDVGSTGGVVTNPSANAVTLAIDGGGDKNFSGVIADGAGAIALTKTGSDTQTLSGANTYSGATIVQEGTLVLSGANTGGGTVTVSGGTLSLSDGNNRVLASTTVTLDNNTILNINAATQTLVNVAIKDHNESATVSGSNGGMLDLSGAVTIATGGSVDRTETLRLNGLKTTATSLTIGKNNSTNWRTPIGYLHVNGGTLTATEIVLAHSLDSSSWNPPSKGELTMSNATVKVSTLKLGQTPDSGAHVYSTVNLGYGSVLLAEEIRRGNTTGTPHHDFNWNNGTIKNYDASTDLAISGLNTFVLQDMGSHIFDISSNRTATVNQVISGDGGLTKIGGGTLNLMALNSYTSDTTVVDGVLAIAESWLGSRDSTVSITSPGKVSLGMGVAPLVGFLELEGVPQANGTWGGPASTAPNQSSLFDGTGVLLVGAVLPGEKYVIWDADNGASGIQDGAGDWDSTTDNWYSGGSNEVWHSDYSATIGSSGSAATVTLTEDISGYDLHLALGYTLDVDTFDLAMTDISLEDNVTAHVVGSGSFALTGVVDNIKFGGVGANKTQTLDLRGLDAFVLSAPSNSLVVGAQASQGGYEHSYLYLAGTNMITLETLEFGGANQDAWSGDTSINNAHLYLGQATTINSDAVHLGASGQPQGKIIFQGGLVNPSLTLRGTTGGNSRMSITIGEMYDVYRASGGSSIDLTTGLSGACVLDAMIETLVVAYGAGLAGNGTCTFSMGGGLLDANLIRLSEAGPGGDSRYPNGVATGVFTQDGGTVRVSNMTFCYDHGLGKCTGKYVMNGGTLCAGSLIRGSGTIVATTFEWNGGTICNIDTNTALSVASGISLQLLGSNLVFDISNGITSTVAAVVSGAGSFTKIGDGELSLTAVNTYTGDTTVSNGVLAISESWLGGTNATLNLATGGKLSLGAGVNAEVKEIYLNDLQYQSGTWGGPESAAEYKEAKFFSGSGILTVLEGGFPGMLFLIQ